MTRIINDFLENTKINLIFYKKTYITGNSAKDQEVGDANKYWDIYKNRVFFKTVFIKGMLKIMYNDGEITSNL